MSLPDQSDRPPFLHGVYVREDFDFQSLADASEPDTDPADDATTGENEDGTLSPPTASALMSDDDFLASLLTPSPESIGIEPADSSDDENGDLSQAGLFDTENGDTEDAETDQGSANANSLPRGQRFPFTLPWLSELELEFLTPVTFLVGENGSGKSTLMEAIAAISGFPVCGGGRNDMSSQFGHERDSELSHAIYPHFKKRPRDGYFFRAEYVAHFASLLDQRVDDPEFAADPYMRYGGRSLHEMSHGEAFLQLLKSRLTSGLYLMDEPESALSPQRQLTLLQLIAAKADSGKCQFVIATHSPILMTCPGATIINMNDPDLAAIDYKDTQHYQLTRSILESPEDFWQSPT